MKYLVFTVALIGLASCTKASFGDDVVPQADAGIQIDQLAGDTLLLPATESIIVEDIVVN